jgi:hypothetical protein
MKRIIRLATHLYPASWRDRYRAEFEVLLEDSRTDGRCLWDVLWGALKMQAVTWTARRIVAAFGIAGALLGASISLVKPEMYRSEATVRAGTGDALLFEAVKGSLGNAHLANVIERQHLYEAERTRKPLGAIIEEMRRDIMIGREFPGDGLRISFRYPDRVRARATVQELVNRIVEAAGADVEQASTPTMPQRRVGPSHTKIIVLGFVCGLVVGLVFSRMVSRIGEGRRTAPPLSWM